MNVRDDIRRILQADAQANQVGIHAGGTELFVGKLAVGMGGGMQDAGVAVRHVGLDGHKAKRIHKMAGERAVTLEGEGLRHVRIVNAFGQTIYSTDLEGNQVRIDLSAMGKGIYMMHIDAEGGQTVRKVVVE